MRLRPSKVLYSIAASWLMFANGVATQAGGATTAPTFTPEQRAWWSLQPLRAVPVPTVRDTRSVRTTIDAFVQAELERRNLDPLPPASRATLLRRAALDLTGLPPTPAEVEAFERDPDPAAFDRVVARLLASPHYGERWARHWLDLARYAESEGFKADETRPNAWRYRDYVVASFNADKPYDRFVQEQIAGDELWPEDPAAHIATAFNRHYPDESNARNLMQRRQEILNDITDTVGSVFCGMTFACARCHDHKTDPLTQADYYRLQAFFANTAADDRISLASPTEQQRYQERLAVWEERTRDIRARLAAIEEPHRRAIIEDFVEKYPDNIRVALARPTSERTPFEHQMVAKARLYLDPESHQYIASSGNCAGRMKKEEKALWQAAQKELDAFASLHPGRLPMAAGMREIDATPPATHLLGRGNWNQPREEVLPEFPSILQLPPPAIVPVALPLGPSLDRSLADVRGGAMRRSSGRRTVLARWLTDPSNPWVARAIVNRVWQYHFGRGLAANPGDLGLRGERPTHPALLDWLAGEFMRRGWSLKELHALILRSAVYQRASVGSSSAAVVADPANQLLGRFPRHRLEGEAIRDAALAVAGRLNAQLGGPSVFPELPPGFETRGGWKTNETSAARNRRSVYVFVRRNTRYPMFEAFDMPDTHETCSRRNVTTSPVQALTLLNSRVTLEWAQSFAGRVVEISGPEAEAQIDAAWRWAFARSPSPEERNQARDFLSTQAELAQRQLARGEPLATPKGAAIHSISAVAGAALVDLCHVLLNSNEFVYLD